MMDYETFKNVIAERIKEFLPPVYDRFEVSFEKVPKINGCREAMILSLETEAFRMASLNLYVDDLYEVVGNGSTLEELLGEAAQLILNFTGTQDMTDDSCKMEDYRDYVVKILINKEKNRELLEMSPHMDFLDLAVVYRLAIEKEDGSGYATAMITYDMMNDMGVDEEGLDRLADVNGARILPTKVFTLPGEMCVITTENKMYGGTNLLRTEQLAGVAGSLNDDLYLIPSSIHEIMAVKVSTNDPEKLKLILKEGNELAIEPDEYLGENIYLYNRKTNKVVLVEAM